MATKSMLACYLEVFPMPETGSSWGFTETAADTPTDPSLPGITVVPPVTPPTLAP